MIHKLYLIVKETLSGGLISIVVFIVTAAAAFSICSFASIVKSVENSIIKKFESAVPPGMIKVSGPGQDGKSLVYISSLKGVKSVYPLIASQIPMQAVISFFGLNYKTDLVCIGAPGEFIGEDIKDPDDKKAWKEWKPGMELPVLIPEILLEAYNNSMAEPNGLPRITPGMAVGRELRIIFGKSSVKEIEGYGTETSRVTGFTDKIKSLCLVIPIRAVKYYNIKFNGPASGDSYMCSYVTVTGHDTLLSVAGRIEKTGLKVETDKTLSGEMLSLKKKFESILFLMMNVVLLLALFAVVFSTMIAAFHRMDYYRLIRVLGASRIFISLSLLFKYSLIGFAGAFCGFFLMQNILPVYASSLKIQGFEIVINTGTISVWTAAGAGAAVSVLAALPALIMIHSSRINLE